jgi:predicted RNase H-like HicB family nuclease
MSAKSKKNSKAIDRPFAPELLRQAKALAAAYQVIIHFEDGTYFGRGLEIPNALSDGRTPEECFKNTREALTAHVAYLLESGEAPPTPASEQSRDEQVNIRVTKLERILIEEAARQRGYRGVSDFVRAATLAATR